MRRRNVLVRKKRVNARQARGGGKEKRFKEWVEESKRGKEMRKGGGGVG